MDIQKLVENVANIYVPEPDDQSGRELFYTCKELNRAIIALQKLVLAQNEIIVDLQQKLANS